MRTMGMGGRAKLPSGRSPVLRKRTIWTRVQPRAWGPAMPGASSAQSGTMAVGRNSSTIPASGLARSGCPMAPRGVWQSPHMATFSTR